jgi:hypothetical protein
MDNSNHEWTLAEGRNEAESKNAKDLPKLVKMALRTRDKQSKDIGELLHYNKDLNPGLSKKKWRKLDTQLELRSQWLILLTDWDSANVITDWLLSAPG